MFNCELGAAEGGTSIVAEGILSTGAGAAFVVPEPETKPDNWFAESLLLALKV